MEEEIGVLSAWVRYVCDTSSAHGLVWYNRTTSTVLKLVVVVFAILGVFGLPVFIVLKVVEFSYDETIKNSVEWVRDAEVTYPKLTICHPKYFDQRRLDGEKDSKALFVPFFNLSH